MWLVHYCSRLVNIVEPPLAVCMAFEALFLLGNSEGKAKVRPRTGHEGPEGE